MKKLATPQTFQLEGGEVDVQDQLAAGLDKGIADELATTPGRVAELDAEWKKLAQAGGENDKATKKKMDELLAESKILNANKLSYDDVTYIGAIILDDLTSPELIDLPNKNQPAALTHSLVGSAYHIVKGAGLEGLVIANTLTTMGKAGQLEYFHKAGLPNKDFAIVVEVHYYRSRPASKTGMHKDTRGDTLFVNLSFTNKQKILGPEYILNPASVEAYENFIAGNPNLPQVFKDDLKKFKDERILPRYINATALKENGVVAFVDEAIHHATPTPGPRTGSAESIGEAVRGIYRDEYDDAKKGYDAYTKAGFWSRTLGGYGPYLKNEDARENAKAWYDLLSRLSVLKDNINRKQLNELLPGYFRRHLDLIIEQAATDFTSVSYSHLGGEGLRVEVREPGEEPLERRMSVGDLSEYMQTATKGGKRSFFRTWVRAVPRDKLPGKNP